MLAPGAMRPHRALHVAVLGGPQPHRFAAAAEGKATEWVEEDARDQAGHQQRRQVAERSPHRTAGSSGDPVHFVRFSAPSGVMKMTSSCRTPISPGM